MIDNWERFFDRQSILERILQGVYASAPTSFALVGAPFVGKTALLRHLASAQSPLRAAQPDSSSSGGDIPQQISLLDGAHFTSVDEFTVQWEVTSGNISSSVRFPANPASQASMKTLHPTSRSILLLDNLDRLLATCNTPSALYTWLAKLASHTPIVATTTQPLYDLNGVAPDTYWHILTPLFLGSIDLDAANRWLGAYIERWPELSSLAVCLFDLTGRHPFLLQRLGDSLDEVQQMLAPGQVSATDSLPFIRLRLAEYGRPLFTSLLNRIQHPPVTLDSTQLWLVLKELMSGPISLKQINREKLPALNWLINQATVLYGEHRQTLSYRLFSPLFIDFLASSLYSPPKDVQEPMVMIYNAQSSSALYEQLTKMEALLLRYLQNHSQMVVSTEQLLADVWKRPDASTRRVQEAIRRLRLQLERHSPPLGEIHNERGRGYRFVPYTETDVKP